MKERLSWSCSRSSSCAWGEAGGRALIRGRLRCALRGIAARQADERPARATCRPPPVAESRPKTPSAAPYREAPTPSLAAHHASRCAEDRSQGPGTSGISSSYPSRSCCFYASAIPGARCPRLARSLIRIHTDIAARRTVSAPSFSNASALISITAIGPGRPRA